jgi:class 3 adenylate cyclase
MFLGDLARRLRERREAQRLTQLDVAQALQVSPQAVSKWERGENAPDIALLVTLSHILGTTSDGLLGRHQSENREFEGTVLVSSVQGFSARCESLRPEEIALWSNGFLHQVTEATVREGGIPVKYVGDALLAFFAGDSHETRAASAAVSARKAVTDPLVIGLASGPLYVTAIGHADFARPDIIGSTVNTAFRINGWAAAHAEARIGAAFSTNWQPQQRFDVVGHPAVPVNGLAMPIEILEINRRV